MIFRKCYYNILKDHEGFTPLNDKSAAEDIYDAFGVSKKTFKKAVGDLYKKSAWLFWKLRGYASLSGAFSPTGYRKRPYELMGKINCGGKAISPIFVP